MPIRRRRSLGAVALRTRADAVGAVEAAEAALAGLDRELSAARARARELAARDAGPPGGERPAALLEAGALGRSADRAALAALRERVRSLEEARSRAARGVDEAREALARAVRAAELLTRC